MFWVFHHHHTLQHISVLRNYHILCICKSSRVAQKYVAKTDNDNGQNTSQEKL